MPLGSWVRLQVFVPGVFACSAGVERGDSVAVSVAVEAWDPQAQQWSAGVTRGTTLGSHHAESAGTIIEEIPDEALYCIELYCTVLYCTCRFSVDESQMKPSTALHCTV